MIQLNLSRWKKSKNKEIEKKIVFICDILHFFKLSKTNYFTRFFTIAIFFSRVLTSIEDMLEKDIKDNRAIGKYGAEAILAQKNVGDDLVHVITHCNTGSLATAGYGTALGIIRALHEAKRIGICQY